MIIWGFRTVIEQVAVALYTCRNCHYAAAHTLGKRVKKFTLFFVPLFPVSSAYHLQCAFCGAISVLDPGQAAQVQVQATAASAAVLDGAARAA
jgi:zinc-ribbon family